MSEPAPDLDALLDAYAAKIREAEVQRGSTLAHLDEQEARAALTRAHRLLREEAETAKREREEWREQAIRLGVKGEARQRDDRRMLQASITVDEKLLRHGGLPVLNATLYKLHDQFRVVLGKPNPAMEHAAKVLNTKLADDARAARAAASSPPEAPAEPLCEHCGNPTAAHPMRWETPTLGALTCAAPPTTPET